MSAVGGVLQHDAFVQERIGALGEARFLAEEQLEAAQRCARRVSQLCGTAKLNDAAFTATLPLQQQVADLQAKLTSATERVDALRTRLGSLASAQEFSTWAAARKTRARASEEQLRKLARLIHGKQQAIQSCSDEMASLGQARHTLQVHFERERGELHSQVAAAQERNRECSAQCLALEAEIRTLTGRGGKGD